MAVGCSKTCVQTAGGVCVQRATSESLGEPDGVINRELCAILNRYPGQTKEVMKILKKRLGSKDSHIQVLVLSVLETLSENFVEYIYAEIEHDILPEMVKIGKKKPDLHVREKILTLIDTWHCALKESGGKHRPYSAAYRKLLLGLVWEKILTLICDTWHRALKGSGGKHRQRDAKVQAYGVASATG